MTLIEVLAVVIILGLVSTLVFSIMINSANQQKFQSSEVKQIQDGAYILKQITKDLRKSYYIKDEGSNNYTLYEYKDDIVISKYRYDNSSKELYRDGILIGSGIDNFLVSGGDENGSEKVAISFNINDQKYNTDIFLRRGDKIK